MTCILHVHNILYLVLILLYDVNGKCIDLNANSTETGQTMCSDNNTSVDKDIESEMSEIDTSNSTEKLDLSMEYRSTDGVVNRTADVGFNLTETSVKTMKDAVTDYPQRPRKSHHMTIIIVGPTAAVSIALFLCIAYYFHNAQLNKKAKRLSFTIYVSPDPSSESVVSDVPKLARVPISIPNSPRPSLRLSRESSPVSRLSREASPNAWLSMDNTEMLGQRRKSTLTVNTLSVPGIQGKRGSQNWNAFADQEILSLSAPRRHSTFII